MPRSSSYRTRRSSSISASRSRRAHLSSLVLRRRLLSRFPTGVSLRQSSFSLNRETSSSSIDALDPNPSTSSIIVMERPPVFPSSTQLSFPTIDVHSTSLSQRRRPPGCRPLEPHKQYRLDLGPCQVLCPDCNASHWIEERSSKGTKQNPKFSACCSNGAISLPPLLDAPPLLQYLLQQTSQGIRLCSHIMV